MAILFSSGSTALALFPEIYRGVRMRMGQLNMECTPKRMLRGPVVGMFGSSIEFVAAVRLRREAAFQPTPQFGMTSGIHLVG
jgi:hypothetical protein